MVRIIAGENKGRKLQVPKGARPTSEKVRGAIFDILFDVSDARALDLFSGSGALGLEALSRGATACTFVDDSKKALEVLERNIADCRGEALSTVRNHDLGRGIPAGWGPFDLILADAPYGWEMLDELVTQFAKVLSPGGRAVVEHDADRTLGDAAGLQRADRRVWGTTAATFYIAEGDDDG